MARILLAGPFPWECRAAQSRQVRPEEVREPSWGAAKVRTLTMPPLVASEKPSSGKASPKPRSTPPACAVYMKEQLRPGVRMYSKGVY